jgi:hypothetical protein
MFAVSNVEAEGEDLTNPTLDITDSSANTRTLTCLANHVSIGVSFVATKYLAQSMNLHV